MDSRLSFDLNAHLREMRLIEQKKENQSKRRLTFAEKQKINLRNIINHKDCLERVESKTQGVRPSWELTTLEIEKIQNKFRKPLSRKLEEIKENVLKKRMGYGMKIPKEWKPKGPYEAINPQRTKRQLSKANLQNGRQKSFQIKGINQPNSSNWNQKIGKQQHIRSLFEHHLISKSLIEFEGHQSYSKTETPKFGD